MIENVETGIEFEFPSGAVISEQVKEYSIEAKWKGAVSSQSGFVAIPMSLLKAQEKLGLNTTDMMVLINLLIHWWNPDSPVFTRSETIAKRMGSSARTVQRSVNKMLKLGLIKYGLEYEQRKTLNFDPLVEILSDPDSFPTVLNDLTDPFEFPPLASTEEGFGA
ncbi:MAG: helix-turn-helix domain-containing protein [Parasphingorhabdus sp.]